MGNALGHSGAMKEKGRLGGCGFTSCVNTASLDVAQRAVLSLTVALWLVTASCSDLPEVGVVGRADDAPLVVFKECDSPEQRVGKLTVYRGGPEKATVVWIGENRDRSQAVRNLPLASSVPGYTVTDEISGRFEAETSYSVEAKSIDGVNMGGTLFRPRDLRDQEVLLDERDPERRYRPWLDWTNCR